MSFEWKHPNYYKELKKIQENESKELENNEDKEMNEESQDPQSQD